MIAVYGKAMPEFVLREIEIGTRAACFEDNEWSGGWSAIDDLLYLGWAAWDRIQRPYQGLWSGDG